MVRYEVLRMLRVRVGNRESRIPLAPIDSFFYAEHTFLSWQAFFDYRLDTYRLLHALEKVAEECPCICGRLTPDSQARYAIEVHPTDEVCHGFPLTEAEADISVAECILKHTKVRAEAPEFPCLPQLPFFMEAIDLSAAHCGKEPLMKVKLTHLTDGCALNLSVSHIVIDGQRGIEIFRDIGRAYCGKKVASRNHDRSCMWPDSLVQHYPFLGDNIARLPRTRFPRQEVVGFPKSYSESLETEILVFSKDMVKGLKKLVSPYLSDGEFVSTNDVLLALLWMLRAEISSSEPVCTAADLRVDSVTAIAVVECVKAGIPAVPENYVGNATIPSILQVNCEDVEDKSFSEVLAFLAILSRKSINATRDQPAVQAKCLLDYYRLLNSPEFRNSCDTVSFTLSNLVRTPVQEVDFGEGRPVLTHPALPMPLYGTLAFAGPLRDDGGILVYCQFLESELRALDRSVVIQTCAPGMKQLCKGYSIDNIISLLGAKAFSS